jgi:hypothetical protein
LNASFDGAALASCVAGKFVTASKKGAAARLL